MRVPRVAGSFHVGVHAGSFGMLQAVFGDVRRINMSHAIHSLRFGPAYAGMLNPLDGFVRTVEEHGQTGQFKYFLKLVPTTVTRLRGPRHHTHQFSVTEYFSPAHQDRREVQLPALLFAYDFSPITCAISERRRSLLHFVSRVCGVVGGVFTMTGLVDQWVFAAVTWWAGGGGSSLG